MMSSDGTEFTLHVDLSVPDEDRNALLSALSAPDVGAKLDMYGAGPVEEIMAAVTVISTAISVGQIAHTFAKAIIQWRQKMRQKGISTKVRVERRGHGSINLEVDTDEAIIIFITKQMRVNQSGDEREDNSSIDAKHN